MSKAVSHNPSPDLHSPPAWNDTASSKTDAALAPSLIDYTLSPTRKTRIVRVRRNSLGVEIERSYPDSTPEGMVSNCDVIKEKQDERLPLSPLKQALIQQRRSSLNTSSGIAYDYNTDIKLDSKISSFESPNKKKIVRVRRNSVGVVAGRTFADGSTNADFSSSGSSNHNDIFPISPSKTRFVRVHRNSLGVEIGRSYVDAPKMKQDIAVLHPNANDAISPVRLSPTPSSGQSKTSMSSPGKISSPRKVASQRMKSLSRNMHMKAMEQSSSDINTLDFLLPSIDTEGRTYNNIEESHLQKNNVSNAISGRSDSVTPISPATAKKVKSLKSNMSPKTADDRNNHFITSPSFRSRSMRMYSETGSGTNSDDHQSQSLRLLRVLLGEDSATMSKDKVDKALEKHAELLRFQLQQKKKIKQRDETIHQEKKQQEEMMEEHKKQVKKLNDDVQKQKLLMKTSLEIKDVEIGILNKESEQKTVKIQQLAWRLAKERAAAKESKSPDIVIAVASSEEGQLSENKEDSNSLLDLLNISEESKDVDDDDISEATPVVGHTSNSNFVSPNKSRKSSSTDMDSDESPAPMKTSQLQKKLDQTEGQLLIAKKSVLQLEKKQQEMELDFEETLHESKAKVSQLKAVLTACNERRRVAEQMLRDLGKFDEATLVKISRKPSKELMSDISEQSISMQVVALTTSESENSSLLTKEHITLEHEVRSLKEQLNEALSHSFKFEVDNEMNAKEVQAAKEKNAKLESQLTNLQMKLEDCEVQLTAAKARNTEKLRATATSLREIEKVTAECTVISEINAVKLKTQLKSLHLELDEARKEYAELQTELSIKIEVSTCALKASEERFSKLEAELLHATSGKEKAEREMGQHQLELDEARVLLQHSESMIQKYADRLQETNSTVKQCENKIAELNDILEYSKSEHFIKKLSSGEEFSAISVEEIHSMLLETQVQVKDYETKLDQVQLALQESEAMAEKYLLMLEEANATLEQSERLMKQYDRMQPNQLLHGSNSDHSEYTSGGSNSEGSDDLSMKSAQELLAYASKRLGIATSASCIDDTSNFADDDISNSQSNARQRRDMAQKKESGNFLSTSSPGVQYESYDLSSATSTIAGETDPSANDLMRKWEKSRLQNESISKIATLETELAERQIQLNDALHKIADLTRNRDTCSTTSGGGDAHKGGSELVKALTEVAELKERVVIVERKYNEATKKLIFLKETVLTVIDAEMSS